MRCSRIAAPPSICSTRIWIHFHAEGQPADRLGGSARGLPLGETACLLTSLPPELAKPALLLQLNRTSWGIEDRVHWVRDVALCEDVSRLRKGALPRLSAGCAKLVVISILRLLRVECIKRTMDQLHLRPDSAVQLLLGSSSNLGLRPVGLALAGRCCVGSPAGLCPAQPAAACQHQSQALAVPLSAAHCRLAVAQHIESAQPTLFAPRIQFV